MEKETESSRNTAYSPEICLLPPLAPIIPYLMGFIYFSDFL